MAHPPAEPLELLFEERVALEEMAASPSWPHRMVRPAKGLVMAADGVANTAIAERLGVSRSTVLGWRRRFAEDGVGGVGRVRPGRGRKPTIPQEKIDQVVHDTQDTTPPDATHWSVRSMAKHAGISKTKVQEIWAARGLKPHLVETFKLSDDPHFEEKLVDVVGLYMNPPEGAVVLSVDEKSQIQARACQVLCVR
ncbi:MAG: IS630 family transposase [Acidimicrobiia bacterium]|nr:IS630 family transposase [Acidimicrobiia bacterium]